MKTKQKAIIVDLDGTLVDSRHRALSSSEEYREKSFDEEYCEKILEDKVNDNVFKKVIKETIPGFVDGKNTKYIIFLSARIDTISVRVNTGKFIRENLATENTNYIQCLKPLDSKLTDAQWKAKMFAEFASYLDIVAVYDDKKENLEAMKEINENEVSFVNEHSYIEAVAFLLAPNCKFYLVEEGNITNLE